MRKRQRSSQRDASSHRYRQVLYPASVMPDVLNVGASLEPLAPPVRPLADVSDSRRFWFSRPAKAPLTMRGRSHQLVIKKTPPGALLAARSRLSRFVGFAAPARIAVCIRRRARREVLFAKGKTWKVTGHRRRNQWSGVHC